jgi:hypothetical protein
MKLTQEEHDNINRLIHSDDIENVKLAVLIALGQGLTVEEITEFITTDTFTYSLYNTCSIQCNHEGLSKIIGKYFNIYTNPSYIVIARHEFSNFIKLLQKQ